MKRAHIVIAGLTIILSAVLVACRSSGKVDEAAAAPHP
jgi:hypothetical protein